MLAVRQASVRPACLSSEILGARVTRKRKERENPFWLFNFLSDLYYFFSYLFIFFFLLPSPLPPPHCLKKKALFCLEKGPAHFCLSWVAPSYGAQFGNTPLPNCFGARSRYLCY